jgi:hypothetical protein
MSSSKRHFTAVIGKKEQGTYVSSTPSSAARKAVSKLCADDKNKKVDFYIRETTQGSKKKVYGMYIGYMEKLKEPIELKGRVIKYKPVAKLSKKKVGGSKNMWGGNFTRYFYKYNPYHHEYDIESGSLSKILYEKIRSIVPKHNLERFSPKNKLDVPNPFSNTKDYSEKVVIYDSGIYIASNIPDFEDIQYRIINELEEYNIDYNKYNKEVKT